MQKIRSRQSKNTSIDGTAEAAAKSDKNDDKESTENTSDSRIAMGDKALKFSPGSAAYAYKEDEMGK